MTPIRTSLESYLDELVDPRRDHSKRYPLKTVIILALIAIIAGANDWVAVERYCKLKRDWLATFLDLSCGIPAHDTFRRVFILLSPAAFQRCFMSWVQAIARLKPGEVVAVDGKTLRRSYDRWSGQEAIEMVSAWASRAGLVLAQRQVAEGSNEIATVPEILQQLVLTGCIVTADAAHCQTKHARIVVERGGDYVFALKDNHGQLYDEVTAMVAHEAPSKYTAVKHERWVEHTKAHGRIETRRYVLVTDAEYVAYFNRQGEWWRLGAIGIVERIRRVGDQVERGLAFFVTSLNGDVKRFAQAVRRYWSIENNLHWTLDVTFQEDLSRARVGFEAANFAVVKHFALNLLKLEKTVKDSLAGKRQRAGWDNDYMLKVLQAGATLK